MKQPSALSQILDSALDDTNIDLSAANTKGSSLLGGEFDFMESFVAFGVVGYTALSSLAGEANRRDTELASLKQHDLPLALAVVRLKQRNKEIIRGSKS